MAARAHHRLQQRQGGGVALLGEVHLGQQGLGGGFDDAARLRGGGGQALDGLGEVGDHLAVHQRFGRAALAEVGIGVGGFLGYQRHVAVEAHEVEVEQRPDEFHLADAGLLGGGRGVAHGINAAEHHVGPLNALVRGLPHAGHDGVGRDGGELVELPVNAVVVGRHLVEGVIGGDFGDGRQVEAVEAGGLQGAVHGVHVLLYFSLVAQKRADNLRGLGLLIQVVGAGAGAEQQAQRGAEHKGFFHRKSGA